MRTISTQLTIGLKKTDEGVLSISLISYYLVLQAQGLSIDLG